MTSISKWSALPVLHMLQSRLRLGPPAELESVAARSWEIAPAQTQVIPRAYFLPQQLDRIESWAFMSEHPRREMQGGIEVRHAATRAYLVEDALLIDGVIYKGRACSHMRPRSRRWPQLHVDREIERAAVVCTPGGNRWFGTWLMDDCPRYPLALAEAMPVTTDQPISPHTRAYEALLGLSPQRVGTASFRELVLFVDAGQNQHKRARCRAIRDKLVEGVEAKPHPGVFVLRGLHGERRVLVDEKAIAERLQRTRGFRIVDPMALDVPTILSQCAGARTVVGIEGSALLHAVVLLDKGANILVLQPPNRFTNLFKHLADRDEQHFGFVVGEHAGSDFRIDADEIERTLDLFPT